MALQWQHRLHNCFVACQRLLTASAGQHRVLYQLRPHTKAWWTASSTPWALGQGDPLTGLMLSIYVDHADSTALARAKAMAEVTDLRQEFSYSTKSKAKIASEIESHI